MQAVADPCACQTQMQYAVTHILSDDGGPDKVVAVVDGRGAGADSEHRPRYVRQAKHLASVLTQVCLVALPACCVHQACALLNASLSVK